MSLVSPLHQTKPTMTKGGELRDEPFDEYQLFILLERQRNMKLRELYHDRSVAIPRMQNQLLKLPPRYQWLDLSDIGSFLNELLTKRRQNPSSATNKEQWKALDRTTKMFLEDMTHVLRELHNESGRITPPPPTTLNPTPITPLHSPSRIPSAASGSNSAVPPEECVTREVNISDDEIYSLWGVAPVTCRKDA